MNKKVLKWFFPGVTIVMFTTLLIALLQDFVPSTANVFISTTMGMISYCIMLTLILIAVRPKALEKKLGLTAMYNIHAWMAIALPVTLFIHVFIRWSGLGYIFEFNISSASTWGYGGLIALVVVMLTGIFVLSDTFIQYFKPLKNLKENYFKRNTHLWLHRLAIVSVIAIHFHVYNVYYLRNNIPFRFLITGYTVFVLGWYFLYKIRLGLLPKYEIVSIEKPTPTIYDIEVKPERGEVLDYDAGQYGFFRFVDSEVTSEAHPFSFSSAPELSHEKVHFMIKESGDFTSSLDQVELGDRVTIEGPYGDYFPHEEKNADTPMVLVSGGIGVTPNLSILRHEIAVNSNRRIAFIWGLAFEEDLMYYDELKQMAEEFPNFSYHLIYSGEEVEGFPYGFVDDEFIRNEGLEELYETANWYVCGPPPMLEATKSLLEANNVDEDRKYIEEFAF